jgi:hypothetical protein
LIIGCCGPCLGIIAPPNALFPSSSVVLTIQQVPSVIVITIKT